MRHLRKQHVQRNASDQRAGSLRQMDANMPQQDGHRPARRRAQRCALQFAVAGRRIRHRPCKQRLGAVEDEGRQSHRPVPHTRRLTSAEQRNATHTAIKRHIGICIRNRCNGSSASDGKCRCRNLPASLCPRRALAAGPR